MLISEKWHVLYTMPKQERKVVDELLKRGFEVFFPLYKTIRQWSDRKKKILVPLFPSYVFIRVSTVNRKSVFEIPGIIRFLSTNGNPDLISPEEICLIKNILDNNPEVHPYDFQQGDCVKVVRGPFDGMEGIIEGSKGNYRLSICIESLNRIVKFDISQNSVERITKV